jgi:hypothetical protein
MFARTQGSGWSERCGVTYGTRRDGVMLRGVQDACLDKVRRRRGVRADAIVRRSSVMLTMINHEIQESFQARHIHSETYTHRSLHETVKYKKLNSYSMKYERIKQTSHLGGCEYFRICMNHRPTSSILSKQLRVKGAKTSILFYTTH